MKKIYLLMLLALPFVYACSDDDEDVADSLSGTTWETTYTDRYYDEDEEAYIREKSIFTLHFYKDTFRLVWDYYEYDDDGEEIYRDLDDIETGNYRVDGTKVYLEFSYVGDYTVLTVDNKKLKGTIYEDYDLTFEKK